MVDQQPAAGRGLRSRVLTGVPFASLQVGASKSGVSTPVIFIAHQDLPMIATWGAQTAKLRLPLWNLLPPAAFWFLAAAVGMPVLLRALHRNRPALGRWSSI
ncbi:MAG: hypothetical protein L0H84_11550 [Pseudonocardia sp.]|nr:hypothetical protein [Pseudonocardia sp.]